jgi:hypothetical protein
MAQFLTISSGLAPGKKAALAPILAISWLSLGAPTLSTAALAAGTCPASGISSPSGAIDLTSDCQVVGNITLSGTASLTITGAVLTVIGNIVLNDQAQVTVTNGGLTFPQTGFSQYRVTLNNSANMSLNNSSFVTTGILNKNYTMALDAYNTSVVDFEASTLSWLGGSWLLGNFHDQSQLIVNNSKDLPTEIYPSDSSRISVSNSNVATLWLEFISGSSATINVPQHDKLGNFNFDFGNSPGFNYSVHMAASSARLGLNSHPNSSMTVNGNGTAGTNDIDLVFGYYIENSTAPVSINGLQAGSDVTRQFTDQGRTLSLNHVNLNPFSWQVYASQSNGYPVTVRNSKINEIAAFSHGLLNISNSVLQIAVAGAVGPGSQMNITGTQIWSDQILAEYGGRVSIAYSGLHGNHISAVGAGSGISMSNVLEYKNGSLSLPCTPAPATGYTPNVNGVPLCNPQSPLGQCSQVSTQSGGVVTGVPACSSIASRLYSHS